MSADFDAFWAAYPKRLGANPKVPARTAFDRALKKGADPQELITAASRYAADKTTKVGTEFIPMASTWLNQSRWEDYLGKGAIPTPSMQTPTHGLPWGSYVWIMRDTPEWEAWKWWKGITPPADRYGGWTFPDRWPPDFVDSPR